jgi:hypothetical protein
MLDFFYIVRYMKSTIVIEIFLHVAPDMIMHFSPEVAKP